MLPRFLNSSTTGCEREPLDAEMRAVLFSRAATLNSTQPLTRAKAPLQLPSSTASSCRALARKALPLEDGHPVIDLTPLEPSPNAKGSHVTSTRDDVVGYLREALVNHGHFYAKTSVLSQECVTRYDTLHTLELAATTVHEPPSDVTLLPRLARCTATRCAVGTNINTHGCHGHIRPGTLRRSMNMHGEHTLSQQRSSNSIIQHTTGPTLANPNW